MAGLQIERMRDKEQLLTADILRSEVSYDQVTGEFQGRRRKPNQKGTIGSVTNRGYLVIRVRGIKYLAHRLAWLHVYGLWPEGILDHKNGDGLDNRIDNIRKASSAQNSANQGMQCRNTSGFKGVYWDKNRGKWIVQIGHGRKYKYLGRFDAAEDAAQAYAKACAELHGEFGRLA